MNALKACNHGHFAARKTFFQTLGVNIFNAGGAMRIGRQNRNLPALPRAGGDAHVLQDNREQARCHLFAGGDDRIIFARVIQGRALFAPGDQLIGLARHGGDDHGHIVASGDLALHMARDILNALNIGDGRAAEFHDQTGHRSLMEETGEMCRSRGMVPPGPQGAYR